MMTTQSLMWINILIAGVFIYWFWRARRSILLRPTRLNLKYKPRNKAAVMKSGLGDAVSMADASYGAHFHSAGSTKVEKNLNVIFMYNGHCWDAFEVLGVPAGSSSEAVKAALSKALLAAQPQSHEFLQAAAEAIHRDRRAS